MHYSSKTTGAVVRELRKRKRWSQDVLSGLAGIARPQLSQIETGKRNPEVQTLWKIADALDIRLSDLMRMVEEKARADDAQSAASDP